jgi:Na+-transporting methylmalonyl-CoA/oxaloacetate decarboxylase gamma subunit
MGMVFLLFFILLVVTACVLTVWSRVDGPPGAVKSGEPEPQLVPVSLEGVLVAQLVEGDISRRQYARAMERIAARDDARHPMGVPPDVT